LNNLSCWRKKHNYGTYRLPNEQGVNLDPDDNMASLLESKGMSIDFPRQGETRQGVIASITQDQILVNVGTKSEGIISGKELESIPKAERDRLSVDQEISVFILDPEDSSGKFSSFLYASKCKRKSWKKAEDIISIQEKLSKSKITGYKKRWLNRRSGHNSWIFLPPKSVCPAAAAMSGDTPEQRWSKMIDEPV
jgi:small subunit ribosomal protein S1